MSNKSFTLPQTNDKIPIIGFGSGTQWQWKKKSSEATAVSSTNPNNTDPDLVNSVISALENGIKHLDTAEFYTTRPDIGKAVNTFLSNNQDKVSRSDLFITDKYNAFPPNTSNILPDGKIRGPYASLKKGLELMNLSYVDLFLLHTCQAPEGLTLIDIWNEMIQLQKEGLAKNIGVSNCAIEHLEIIKNNCEIIPQVLQIEFHPYLQNQSPHIIDFCQKNNILVEAYGPLVPLTKGNNGPLTPLLEELSKKYNVSTSNILLRWVIQQNIVAVTTTSKVERMKDIQNVYDFKLDDDDFQKISQIGDKWFFRGFNMYPVEKYNDELIKERNVTNA